MKKVLVVDDEESITNLLKGFLTNKGLDVHVAANGFEGLRMAMEIDYHFVVTDVKMPGISGIVLINDLLKIKPSQRFIIITGQPLEEPLHASIPVFNKPFSLNDIYGLISKKDIPDS